MEEQIGWYRRNLPHFDAGGKTQFLTFRLADSLPRSVLQEIEHELKNAKGNFERMREERVQHYLDQGCGSCVLIEPRCATIVQDALKFLDGRAFDLRAWVVMPNHVHFLAFFQEGQSLIKALHSLKSFTAHEIVKAYPNMVPCWQQETFDRYIRNEDHYLDMVEYIHQNPVKAGLCTTAETYPWSSALSG